MKTKNPAWLQLLDEVHQRMDSLGEVAAVGLILPSRTGHDAPPPHDQRALQIAQSLLLLEWFDQQYAVLSRPKVAHWLESVAQPTCGFLMRSWNSQFERKASTALHQRQEQSNASVKFGCFELDQRLRQLVREATREIQISCRAKKASRDVVESILELTDMASRRAHGVYFTPPELARFVVKQINRLLQTQAAVDRQIERNPYILDPAVGAGIFLVKVIECAYESLASAGRANFCAAAKMSSCPTLGADFVRPQPPGSVFQRPVNGEWSEHVTECLLPRLIGCDVMLPSLLATHLNIVVALEKTGFDFRRAPRLNLFLANCLADSEHFQADGNNPAEDSLRWLQSELDLAFAMLRETAVNVIIGNPPFYSMSQNDGRWIQSLLRGECIASAADFPETTQQTFVNQEPNYFEIDGEPLKEKKAWLHDDYVKFMRYAQWQIDRAGSGVLGLVTNRGFLDNITFRGMRYQLLQSFDHIEIFDLHGDSRNQSAPASITAANGERDENIFEIETGIAVTLFGKEARSQTSHVVKPNAFAYESLHGPRSKKLERLQAIDAARELTREAVGASKFPEPTEFEPAGPNYFFVSHDLDLHREYERGFRLCDIMPQAWSAPVTARDHFVVAFDVAELEERLVIFRNAAISDDELRQQFFRRTRSLKYPLGDSRSWKLPSAREQIAADVHWRDCIQTCAYRPFDQRSVFWSNAIIDWPRNELVRQLRIDGNLALIGRRQSPRDAEYNFFFVADQLMLDGIIRSDNRGNESIFPLYVELARAAGQSPSPEEVSRIVPNFSADFIQDVCQRWQFAWSDVPGDLIETIGPLDLLHYVYALFHASAYRRRYRELLCLDFPRVFVCRTTVLAKQLIALGTRLVVLHLLRDIQPSRGFKGVDSVAARTIEAGFPKYQDSNIYLNKAAHLPDVSRQVWQYHVGSHQVARKWLKDRRGRSLSDGELLSYARSIAAIENTIVTCREMDRAIDAAGGWQQAFAY